MVVLASVPAVATEAEEVPAGEIEEGSVGEQPVEFDYQPAVIVDDSAADPVEPAWTTKFLVPTGLLLAAVALVSTVVMYFVRVVRTRYKVVE